MMIRATLRLFNAVPVDFKQNQTIPQTVFERTIKNGYVLDPSILPDNDLLDAIESVVGISGDRANSAFHKSWSVVQNASMESLITQQIIHYITTYGYENLGIYREDAVYIPREILDLPDIGEDLPLVPIKALDADEFLNRIILLGSGIALPQETLDDILTIIKSNNYGDTFIEHIGNRELKSLVYDHYGIVPEEPIEFLRHLISKLTDESLLIKNDALIEKIKASNGKFLDVLIKEAPDDLASIFYRYKPLFLAMRSISNNKTFFNQLRKKAKRLHTPLPEDYLNSITSQIKHKKLDLDRFVQKIENANIFRKIRLAYALSYRLGSKSWIVYPEKTEKANILRKLWFGYSPDYRPEPKRSIVYRVRNGSGWATAFHWHDGLERATRQVLDILLASITDDIRKNVNGKTIYIPANVHYALPATEKQFTGHLPTGSWVSVPEDLIVGIHWTNTEERRIDLDLSIIGVSGKIGWDASYRSDEGDILFSGDVTDAPAPQGASELFYINRDLSEPKILIANYYNFEADDPVDCKIITAHENPKKFGENYMIDINNVISTAHIKISRRQNVLGLITNINGENRVYYANVSIGNSITASKSVIALHARNYLMGSAVNSICFRKILGMAGATLVSKIPDGYFLNLSPEMLNKDTFINLINP